MTKRTLDDIDPFVPDGTLADKVIIITGTSQGVGKAAAYGFARAGASVALCARRGAIVKEMADEITSLGGHAIGLECDVTKEDQVQRLVEETASTFGRIDGLFNNAGIDTAKVAFCDVDFEDWKAVHDVKIHGSFLTIKYTIPVMISGGGGAIVNNGSTVAHHAFVPAPYAASSQAAIIGLTKVAAATYAKDNIRVNTLTTGGIMGQERADTAYEGMLEPIIKMIPQGRMGRPSEDAQVAAWLLSDYASFVNGTEIAVDGASLAGSGNYMIGR
ncbi:SDR family NAD(P)-dependent oxidoreductase [Mycolicibacterium sp.]|uniref:SDR family NAD(P)-dependent oxidoreductase n=1 Tax=Mycolicibacterium sp. TaxID=2320850 RepID=UPI001A1B43A4|nr:SDR family NAD(P)-dependent oxidoreductase [Mycolicibacterium sp.]MBJ7336514.1 SDR family oxidoreductase [Mycolicibacterium sp.]